MREVLIWFVFIVGFAGIVLFLLLARAAGWADARVEELSKLENFYKKEGSAHNEQI